MSKQSPSSGWLPAHLAIKLRKAVHAVTFYGIGDDDRAVPTMTPELAEALVALDIAAHECHEAGLDDITEDSSGDHILKRVYEAIADTTLTSAQCQQNAVAILGALLQKK